jgi:hypothetical protein
MAYTTMNMIHKEVHGTFAPYQMVWFFVDFKIIDITIWSNLTFEQFFFKIQKPPKHQRNAHLCNKENQLAKY